MKLSRNKQVVCADGFRMSVQAGEGMYCTPRDDNGPYSEVEIGYPSSREECIMPYCEDPERPTDTVYGYVPKQFVTYVIAKHGGMISGGLPNGLFMNRFTDQADD